MRGGKIGEGKRGLSGESPLFPSPNPSPSPPKTFDLIESLSSVFPIGRRPPLKDGPLSAVMVPGIRTEKKKKKKKKKKKMMMMMMMKKMMNYLPFS
ncbi:hypothetical protein AB4095_12965 [Bilophila wadsworthia]|uniref:hypothetical protein n=1 Tax=Bilophila wadsworthia TaxID=35833 RepID=UPI0034CF20C5